MVLGFSFQPQLNRIPGGMPAEGVVSKIGRPDPPSITSGSDVQPSGVIVMMQRLLCAIAFLLACPIAFAECPKPVEELLFPPNNLRTRTTAMTFTWSPVEAMGYELVLIRNNVPVKVTEIAAVVRTPTAR